MKNFKKMLDFWRPLIYNIGTVKIDNLYEYTGQDVERSILWKI